MLYFNSLVIFELLTVGYVLCITIERLSTGDRITNSPLGLSYTCTKLNNTYFSLGDGAPRCIAKPLDAGCKLYVSGYDSEIPLVKTSDVNTTKFELLRKFYPKICDVFMTENSVHVNLQHPEIESEWKDVTSSGIASYEFKSNGIDATITVHDHFPGLLLKIEVACLYGQSVRHDEDMCALLKFSGSVSYNEDVTSIISSSSIQPRFESATSLSSIQPRFESATSSSSIQTSVGLATSSSSIQSSVRSATSSSSIQSSVGSAINSSIIQSSVESATSSFSIQSSVGPATSSFSNQLSVGSATSSFSIQSSVGPATSSFSNQSSVGSATSSFSIHSGIGSAVSSSSIQSSVESTISSSSIQSSIGSAISSSSIQSMVETTTSSFSIQSSVGSATSLFSIQSSVGSASKSFSTQLYAGSPITLFSNQQTVGSFISSSSTKSFTLTPYTSRLETSPTNKLTSVGIHPSDSSSSPVEGIFRTMSAQINQTHLPFLSSSSSYESTYRSTTTLPLQNSPVTTELSSNTVVATIVTTSSHVMTAEGPTSSVYSTGVFTSPKGSPTPVTTTKSPMTSKKAEGDGDNVGLIAGLSVGVVIIILLIYFVLLVAYKRKRKAEEHDLDIPEELWMSPGKTNPKKETDTDAVIKNQYIETFHIGNESAHTATDVPPRQADDMDSGYYPDETNTGNGDIGIEGPAQVPFAKLDIDESDFPPYAVVDKSLIGTYNLDEMSSNTKEEVENEPAPALDSNKDDVNNDSQNHPMVTEC